MHVSLPYHEVTRDSVEHYCVMWRNAWCIKSCDGVRLENLAVVMWSCIAVSFERKYVSHRRRRKNIRLTRYWFSSLQPEPWLWTGLLHLAVTTDGDWSTNHETTQSGKLQFAHHLLEIWTYAWHWPQRELLLQHLPAVLVAMYWLLALFGVGTFPGDPSLHHSFWKEFLNVCQDLTNCTFWKNLKQ